MKKPDDAVTPATDATPPANDAPPARAAPPAEQPAHGGSYERKPDGSLKRVAFTDHAPLQGDPEKEA